MIPSRQQEPTRIKVPRFFIDRNRDFDWEKFFCVIFGMLAFVAIAVVSLCIVFHMARALTRQPGPPPKVIYKTIHESAMSGAQNAYIQQCEQNTQDGGNDNVNQGVPNVSVQPWTCTYAK